MKLKVIYAADRTITIQDVEVMPEVHVSFELDLADQDDKVLSRDRVLWEIRQAMQTGAKHYLEAHPNAFNVEVSLF